MLIKPHTLYLIMLLVIPFTQTNLLSMYQSHVSKTNYNGKEVSVIKGKIFAINEPLALIVSDIVGGYFEVDSILPPGVDPHSFQLTPEVIDKLSKSKLIVLIDPENFGLEEKIVELDSLRSIPKLFLKNYTKFGWRYLSVEGFGTDYHGSWLSPRNALSIAIAVKETLIRMYPEIENDLNDNLFVFYNETSKLIQSLNQLAKKYETKKYRAIAMIPPLAYVANWTELNIDEIVLSEPNQELSLSRYSNILDKLKSSDNYIILAPKEFKDTKVGELAEQFAKESGSPIVYVPIFTTQGLSDYIEFLRIAMYSIFGVIGTKYAIGGVGSEVSTYMQIALVSILIIAVLEAFIIYNYKRKEWELAEVDA